MKRPRYNKTHPKVGDIVRINPEAWAASIARLKWTDPERDARTAADTYRVVEAYESNPFVAVVSLTTGRRSGLHIRVLDLSQEVTS